MEHISLKDKDLKAAVRPLGNFVPDLETALNNNLDPNSITFSHDLNRLAHMAKPRETRGGDSKTVTIEEKSKEALDGLIRIAARNVYWRTLSASVENPSIIENLEGEAKTDARKLRVGGMPSEVSKSYRNSEQEAETQKLKLNIFGLPSNYRFSFGQGKNKIELQTTNQYPDLDGVSVFDNVRIPRILSAIIGAGTGIATLAYCTPTPEMTQTVELTSTQPAKTEIVGTATEAPLPQAQALSREDMPTLLTDRPELSSCDQIEGLKLGSEAYAFCSNADSDDIGLFFDNGKWVYMAGFNNFANIKGQVGWLLPTSSEVPPTVTADGLPVDSRLVLSYNLESPDENGNLLVQGSAPGIYWTIPQTSPLDEMFRSTSFEPTSEKPVEKVNMTKEKWVEFFDQESIYTPTGNLNYVLDSERTQFMSSDPKDSEVLEKVDESRSFDVLRKDGVIEINASKEYALSRLLEGDTVILSRDPASSGIFSSALRAANNWYTEGKRNPDGSSIVTLEFILDEDTENKKMNSWSIELTGEASPMLIETDSEGRKFTPIIPDAPPSMTVWNSPFDQINIDPDLLSGEGKHWIEVVLSQGEFRYLVLWEKNNELNIIP